MAKNPDWTNEQKVFKFIEKLNKRPLLEGERELIIGQRQINRRFFDAINAILDVVSASPSASPKAGRSNVKRLADLKKEFQTVPGERPPGCKG